MDVLVTNVSQNRVSLSIGRLDVGESVTVSLKDEIIGGEIRETDQEYKIWAEIQNLVARGYVTTTTTGSIDTAAIEDNSITAAKIAANAVITSKILNLNVTTGKIADLAITTGKLAALVVTDAKLASDGAVDANRAVGTNHIKDLAVTTGKVAANAVVKSKVAYAVVTATITNPATSVVATLAGGAGGVVIGVVPASSEAPIQHVQSVVAVDNGANLDITVTLAGAPTATVVYSIIVLKA